jgi:hypothetical protein
MKKQLKEVPTPSPLDEIKTFVQEEAALKRALVAAEGRVTKAESALDSARRALASAQADRLVQDPDADLDGEATSAEFIQASLHVEEARAALGGVRRKIADRDVQLLTLVEKLRTERAEFNQKAVERFLSDTFTPAAEAFAQVLRIGAALETALGETVTPLHHLPVVGEWDEDAAAKAVLSEHVGPKRLAESLEEFRKDAEMRLYNAEQTKRFRASFDPTAKYRVIRPFINMGKNYDAGTVMDRYEVPLFQLARLYEARRLQMIEPGKSWEDA